jgi:hypothetical protein
VSGSSYNKEYAVYGVTQAGFDWLEKNQERLMLKDDPIPF